MPDPDKTVLDRIAERLTEAGIPYQTGKNEVGEPTLKFESEYEHVPEENPLFGAFLDIVAYEVNGRR